jgi:hypothetical protein
MSLDWSKFEEAREAFAALGFNVIPLPPGSKGAQGSGVRFAHLNKQTDIQEDHGSGCRVLEASF